MNASKKSAMEFLKHYSWNSIFYRYWRKLGITTVIPFVLICTIIYFSYSNSSKTKTEQYALMNFINIDNQISQIFSNISETHNLIRNYGETNVFLNYPNMQNGNISVSNFSSNIIKILELSKISFIDNIYLYSSKNNYVLSTLGGGPVENFSYAPWYQTLSGNSQYNMSILTESFNPQTKSNVITIIYTIYFNFVPCGIIAFELNVDTLNELLGISSNSVSAACIIDTSQNTNYTVGTKTHFDFSDIDNLKEKELTHFNGFLTYKSIIANELELILMIKPEKATFNSLNIAMFIGMFILAIVFPLIISYYLSREFYHLIENIVASFHSIQLSSDDKKSNEISYITQNIMRIQDKNINLENELTKNIAIMKNLQSIALQTQFSPHFLFNTLNSISTITIGLTKSNNPAAKIINLLADLLTEALDTTTYIIPLSEELSYLKKYIEIEQIKSNNSFDTIWEVDNEIQSVNVVKFMMQPIVENSFQHGIKYLRGLRKGLLKIKGYRQNKEIILAISDNGIGITDTKLKEIRNALEINDMPNPKHIGLCNVNRRIKLLFGEKYGVTINSTIDTTTVEFILPFIN